MKSIFLITLTTISSHCQYSNNWEEFPLTETEITLIQEESGDKSRIQLKNNQNQTCVLTPGLSSSPGTCTWRSQRQCKQVPTVTKVPVFSPWCSDHGEAGHLANCQETIRRRPLVHSVVVCTPSGAPDCRGPCYQCPEYCEPVQQSWCEVSHSISTVVMEKSDCDYNNDEGRCKQVVKRVEKDIVTQNENCYQKNTELCGPANCKFVNKTMDCHEKNSSVMVDLRQRECIVCQPSLADKVEVLDICDDILTHDCNNDPLSKPWKKVCNTDKSQFLSNGIIFKFDENRKNNISVQDLVQQSLEPVQNLLSKTLLQIRGENVETMVETTTTKKFITSLSPATTTTPLTTTTESALKDESKEDISEILNLLNHREPVLKNRKPEETIFFVNSITTTSEVATRASETSKSTPAASVYFDPVLNTQLAPASTQPSSSKLKDDPTNMNKNKSPSSLTEFLNFQLEHQFSEKTSTTTASTPTNVTGTAKDRENTKFAKTTTLINSANPAQNDTASVETSSTSTDFNINITATTFITTTTTTSTTTTSVTSTTTISTITTSLIFTTTTTIPPTSTSDTRHKMQLSPADFLRLCFVSQIGCDFSHNEILENEEKAIQTTTIGSTSTSAVSDFVSRKPKGLSKKKEEKLRQMIRNCFLNGICDGSNYGGSDDGTDGVISRSSTTPRTVSETTKNAVTLSYREQEIQRRVRERARACFFDGVCN